MTPPITPRLVPLALLAALSFALAHAAVASSTQTFSNASSITINDNTTASPYPSNISIGGAPSLVTKVTVRLNGFSHTFPDDVDVLLVGPTGQRTILMSDAGGGNPGVGGVTLDFDQAAANIVPDGSGLATGTFRPANYPLDPDNFPSPGPGSLTGAPADLSVFNLTNPNGIWNLYVVDDAGGDVGTISGGWQLIVTVPAIFTVTNTNDSGAGSLRAALAAAGDGDLINFSALFNTPQTITLTSALDDITKSITIVGPGANLLTVRRDPNVADFGIFTIPFGVANGVAISGMTITGGRATAPANGGFGGGVFSLSNLTLSNVHLTGNTARLGGGVALASADGVFTGCTFNGNLATTGFGGAIYFAGSGNRTLRIINSTVSGNQSSLLGSGVVNISSQGDNSRIEIISSTIANNTSSGGAGIDNATSGGANSTATTTLRNTIIAGNSPNNLGISGAATFQTLGFNLSNNYNGAFTPAATDKTGQPLLGPLCFNGGTMPTHTLLGGSPALDAGNASGFTTDQRGAPRSADTVGVANVSDGSDIGAVEMQSLVVTATGNGATGTLRNMLSIADQNSSLTDIIFDPAVFNTPQIITLTTGELTTNSNVTINGPGANLLTITGNNGRRVFSINSFSATLTGMTITGGNGVGANSSGFGGGIFSQANLTISDCVISSNTASNGGGIGISAGTFSLLRSTLSNNTANFQGAGLNVQNASGTLTSSTISGNTANSSTIAGAGVFFSNISGGNPTLQLTNCTIANNTTGTSNTGGGINVFASAGSATTFLRNTIIANNALPNLAKSNAAGATTAITSQGFNLANDSGGSFLTVAGDKINAIAGLGSLGNNGGATPTHALLGTSAALDAGNNSGSGILTDQRGKGFPRTADLSFTNASGGDGTDIGAFEAQTEPATPFISISNSSAPETNSGSINFIFDVTLSAASGLPITVTYQTADGTATAPSDYTAIPPTTLTFAPGETNKQISVSVNGDTLNEADETFFVNLSNPSNANTAGQGTGTILNDDPAPSISINDISQNEGTGGTTNFNFTVLLSFASGQPISVTYSTADGTATAPSDYTAVSSGVVTLNAGETSKQFTVSVVADATLEPDETFFVNLLSATGGATITDNQGQATILNDDPIVVTNTNDDGAGSFRQAILDANANGASASTINFSAPLNAPQTITLTTGELVISSNLTITGPGANLLTISGNNQSRVFSVSSGFIVNLNGMTVAGGNGAGAAFNGNGGSIVNFGSLTVSDCAISGNSAAAGGGGIFSLGGTFNLIRSTVSNNTAAFHGGGLNLQNGNGTLTNSTISGNIAAGGQGGGGMTFTSASGGGFTLQVEHCTIVNNTTATANTGGGILTTVGGGPSSATVTLNNTIIANNSSPNLQVNGGMAVITSQGFNLTNDNGNGFLTNITDKLNANPGLAPLALYGGTTPTHALLANSDALDRGDFGNLPTDQRGRVRPFDTPSVANFADGSDIGAVEMQSVLVTNTNDANAGSLRQAIIEAPPNSDILFATPLFNSPQTITLTSGELLIDKSLNIIGTGANLLTVRRALNATNFRIFDIPGGVTSGVALGGMTITGGQVPSDLGGGIHSLSNLTLTGVHVTGNQAGGGGGVDMDDGNGVFAGCTFSNNSAISGGNGGAIFYQASGRTLRIINSTLSGNDAGGGGGITSVGLNNANTRVEIVSSTIANNSASFGGGILTFAQFTENSSATTTLRNTIIANDPSTNLQVGGGAATFQTLGFNLSNDFNGAFIPLGTDINNANAGLAALALNNGTTPTHALLTGSPALDKGNRSGTTSDQRGIGFPRTIDFPAIADASGGDGTDIGAFETQPVLRITSITKNGNVVTIQGVGVPTGTHRILATTDLLVPFDPTPIGTATADANGNFQSTDNTSLPRRFYRLVYP